MTTQRFQQNYPTFKVCIDETRTNLHLSIKVLKILYMHWARLVSIFEFAQSTSCFVR